MTCARSTPYNEILTIAVNGQKIKQADKVKFFKMVESKDFIDTK